MEFLVVSDSKLKIMMSCEDMKKYGIDTGNVDYDNPRVRRSFWKILDQARERCGFEASGDKVLIQFYPSKDGSEIFVTKLGIISKSAERAIEKSSKVAMLRTKRTIYKFSTFAALISAAKILKKSDFEGTPRAYYDDSGAYYIIADEKRGIDKNIDVSLVSEFGVELPMTLTHYVMEHSSEISFDVLTKL